MNKDFLLYAKNHHLSSTTLQRYADYMNPCILEEKKLNVATLDVFSRLMLDRIIFLGVPIDDDVTNIIQAQLLYLANQNTKEPIKMYINTPGGSVSAGLGIYDTMKLIEPNVDTICTGMAASMGSILLSAGDDRSILPHAKVMIHQPLGGVTGQASDIIIEAEEIKKCYEELCGLLSENTKQPYEKVYKDMDRDLWFTAPEALEYGLVDRILTKK